jgi:arginase
MAANQQTMNTQPMTALAFIGAASGSGGRDMSGNAAAPIYAEPRLLTEFAGSAHWQATALEPAAESSLLAIRGLCTELAQHTQQALQGGALPVVIGGDHSCAVGTWSGVAAQVRANQAGEFGLMWIDAHMDSHTFATSDTGNIHGMPLAALLGHGDVQLTTIAGPAPKLMPGHVVMFGIRSYEEGEAALLRNLGVRVYFMDEIAARGVDVCFAEALALVNRASAGFGITFDLDALDPADAPATCCHEPGGLRLADMQRVLATVPAHAPRRLLAAEFVELNPHLPGADATVHGMAQLIAAVCGQPLAAAKPRAAATATASAIAAQSLAA